jgi:formate-dependent phosphoribosylglycinamide formyltransferase (GAR transformylase)
VDAAKDLGWDLTVASEHPSTFEEDHPANLLTLPLGDPDAAIEKGRAFAARHPISAVVGVDDDTTVLAAQLALALGLEANPVQPVEAARSKLVQRKMLRSAGVPVPEFRLVATDDDPERVAAEVPYPCVLKPLALSASKGVIRADDAEAFVAAHARLKAILAEANPEATEFLVEGYVPGEEYALEGLLVDGRLHVLALFDKPDPLEGPFFEETIYVTPSRLPEDAQERLAECAGQATGALGLIRGPVHVELRLNDDGPWLIELAARPIGGKCGRVLRFGDRSEYSLEHVILGHAMGILENVPAREESAAGVMMIPTPAAGVLEEVHGVEAARAVSGIEDVVITGHRGMELIPLPEGGRYLGFIFARGSDSAGVEEALRQAHGRLAIRMQEGG